jgi:hypothetical protein
MGKTFPKFWRIKMSNVIALQAPAPRPQSTPLQQYAAEIITFLSEDDDCESVFETLRLAGYSQ